MLCTITSEGYRAAINSTGAELKSFQSPDGTEYMWNADPAFWDRTSPVLFPIVSHLRNNKTIINGQEYTMRKHGFLRDRDFELKESGEDFAVFHYVSGSEDAALYPFSFGFTLSYRLEGSTLSIGYTVENTDSLPMLYNLGAHPGFRCPLKENEQFTDYVIRMSHEECQDSPLYDLERRELSSTLRKRYFDNTDTLPLQYEHFLPDAVVLEHPNSSKASYLNPTTGQGVEVDFTGWPVIAFWTRSKPQGETQPNFICIEPWVGTAVRSGESDDFSGRAYIQQLEPGQSDKYNLTIRLL